MRAQKLVNSPRLSSLSRTTEQLLVRHKHIVMRQSGEDVGVIELGAPDIARPDPLVHGREIKHRNGRGAGENLRVLVELERLPLTSARQQNVAVGGFERER